MGSVTRSSSPFDPILPPAPGRRARWGHLYGASRALAIAEAARRHPGLVLAVTPDTSAAHRLGAELGFFLGPDGPPLLHFPDRETLPYDVFSPHQDLVSERLATLYRLPEQREGVLIVPAGTLMGRVSPPEFLLGSSFLLSQGERLDLQAMRTRLERFGYRCVGQVMDHGEFAVRGSLIDLFPSASARPLRIDLLDDEVDSIRAFDPETQRSSGRLGQVQLLPAREFPLTEPSIQRFRGAWRARFEGDPNTCPTYREVSEGRSPAGVEYYLPLFFERLHSNTSNPA